MFASALQTASNSSVAPIYVPGQVYNVKNGVTEDEFGSRNVDNATIVENGFLREPASQQWAIMICNLTMEQYIFNLFPTFFDKQKGTMAWDPAKLYDSIPLMPGTGSHFVVPPWGFHIAIEGTVTTENGATRPVTPEGWDFMQIRGYDFTITEGELPGSFHLTENDKSSSTQYARFFNTTNDSVTCNITRRATAYQLSDQELAHLRNQRKPDFGAPSVSKTVIKPNSYLQTSPPHKYYELVVTETPEEEDGIAHVVVTSTNNYFDPNRFVVRAKSRIERGQIGILVYGNNRKSVKILVRTPRQIIPVSGNIVDNNKQGRHS